MSGSESESESPIPADTRTAGRDVFFYYARNPTVCLGGLILANGVTNANFHSMVEIALSIPEPYSLRNEDGDTVHRDARPLLRGKYYIVTDSKSSYAFVVRARHV
jgi:hypothetical protein